MEKFAPPPSAAEHRLVVVSQSEIRAYPLVGTRWTIGRGPDCDLRLADRAVSQRHVLVERVDDEFRFSDLGSVNPVLFDGRVARSGVLAVGQTLLVGTTRLTLDRAAAGLVPTTDGREPTEVSRVSWTQDGAPQVSPSSLDPAAVAAVVERLEWALADRTAPEDLAAPMLELALGVTGRPRGVLGTFTVDGFRTLASADRGRPNQAVGVPPRLLADMRAATEPVLLTTESHGDRQHWLLAPMGDRPDGLLVLAADGADAPAGQAALRLARALATLIWRRLQHAERQRRTLDGLEAARSSQRFESVASSARLLPARTALRLSAAAGAPTLLHAEPGSEAEELVRFAHAAGPRREQRLEVVAVTELHPDKCEHTIFGDDNATSSAIARARAGTLLLLDVENLSPALQDRLARSFGGRAGRDLDVHLVATQRVDRGPADADAVTVALAPPLGELFAANTHEVAPLRHDARDIVIVAEQILAALDPTGRRALTLSERTRRLLTDYCWPENVDELRRVLAAAAERAGSGPIGPRHLPKDLVEAATPCKEGVEPLDVVEKREIREALRRLGGNRTRAAAALGIAASTLYEKIKRYAIND